MRKTVLYLSPDSEVTRFCKNPIICNSGDPTVSGSYSDDMGDEGAPGGDISGDDIIDGGTF